MNSLIDKLPFITLLLGCYYCDPGTKLAKRLARGDKGINDLDGAYRLHDIAYSQNKGQSQIANKILAEKAWKRVKVKDKLGLKSMKAKFKLNMRLKKKIKMKIQRKKALKNIIEEVRLAVKNIKKPMNNKNIIKMALHAARKFSKGKKKKNDIPRIIPVQKIGGTYNSNICRFFSCWSSFWRCGMYSKDC